MHFGKTDSKNVPIYHSNTLKVVLFIICETKPSFTFSDNPHIIHQKNIRKNGFTDFFNFPGV